MLKTNEIEIQKKKKTHYSNRLREPRGRALNGSLRPLSRAKKKQGKSKKKPMKMQPGGTMLNLVCPKIASVVERRRRRKSAVARVFCAHVSTFFFPPLFFFFLVDHFLPPAKCLLGESDKERRTSKSVRLIQSRSTTFYRRQFNRIRIIFFLVDLSTKNILF